MDIPVKERGASADPPHRLWFGRCDRSPADHLGPCHALNPQLPVSRWLRFGLIPSNAGP